MIFTDKLNAIVKKNNSLLCIGLDSDIDKIPSHIKNGPHPQSTYNKAIIDATADLVCAYKPNSAFYEARGKAGIEALKMTCDYIRDKYPQIPIILDAKRADIGNTNQGYIKFVFDYLGADAVTLNPYLGKEALKSFLDREDKGIFILCRTSNPGAGEFQDLILTNDDSSKAKKAPPRWPDLSAEALAKAEETPRIAKPLYQIVAQNWNYNKNCGLVVGAPYPEELDIVRHIVGDEFPLLIPGVGAQGGDVEKTVKAGIDKDGKNVIINSSRSIIFASSKDDFTEKARSQAHKLRDEINKYR